MGFASSRKEARQLVRHGHFTVNGHKENIPSFAVKAGDSLKVRKKAHHLQNSRSSRICQSVYLPGSRCVEKT